MCFVRSEDWSEEQRQWLSDYFVNQVVPVLSPLTFDPSRPFPRVLNKSLNFIIRLHGKDAFGRSRHRGMVQAPRSLPRIIRLPERLSTPEITTTFFCRRSSGSTSLNYFRD